MEPDMRTSTLRHLAEKTLTDLQDITDLNQRARGVLLAAELLALDERTDIGPDRIHETVRLLEEADRLQLEAKQLLKAA
jgi:hypothetical protein